MNLRRAIISVAICAVSLALTGVAAGRPRQSTAKTQPAPSTATGTKEKVQPDKGISVPEAEAEITRLQQRAVSIIREAARDSVTLEDRRSIARIQARAASAIWKFDRENARELFEKAFETAITHYRETKNTGSERLPNGPQISRADVRQEVIRAVTKFDPTLAKTMTERFIEEKRREIAASQAKTPSTENALLGKVDPAAEQVLSLAFSLLETDREASVGLARRALEVTIPIPAAGYLVSLANLDRDAADQLFLYALATLGRQEIPVPGQLLVLSAYPFGEDRISISDGNSNSSYGFGKPKAFDINPVLIRSFFERATWLLGRTVQINTELAPDLVRVNSGLFAARYLETKVAQYEPSLSEKWPLIISALYGAASEASRTGVARSLENMARDARTSTAADAEDRIKSLLDQAEKTTNFAQRDERYAQAALGARATDLTRALGIADKISDLDFRQSVRDWINFDASTEALSAQKIEEAQRYARDVTATDQRAYLLFQIAKSLLKDRDRARAIDLLEEAARRAADSDNSAEKLRALLGICSVYASIDPTRAFEIGADAMKVASKVPDYGPDTTTLFRGMKRQGGGGASYSSSSADEFDVGKTLSVLARSDLERALNLAQSIESRPLQLLTIVAVATSILDSK